MSFANHTSLILFPNASCRPDDSDTRAAASTPNPTVTVTPAGSLTAESCYTACQAKGTTYTSVGIDGSGDCICYATFPDDIRVDDDGLNGLCNSPCKGDTAESCGSNLQANVAVSSVYAETLQLQGCYL